MSAFRILLIALCLVHITIMDLTGIECMCTLQNSVWGFRTQLFSLMRKAQASVASLEKQSNTNSLPSIPRKKALVSLYKLKEKVVFPLSSSGGQGGEKQTPQAIICSALHFRLWDLATLIGDEIPWQYYHCPCSSVFPHVFPCFDDFLHSLAGITKLTQSAHHCASVSLLHRNFGCRHKKCFLCFPERNRQPPYPEPSFEQASLLRQTRYIFF